MYTCVRVMINIFPHRLYPPLRSRSCVCFVAAVLQTKEKRVTEFPSEIYIYIYTHTHTHTHTHIYIYTSNICVYIFSRAYKKINIANFYIYTLVLHLYHLLSVSPTLHTEAVNFNSRYFGKQIVYIRPQHFRGNTIITQGSKAAGRKMPGLGRENLISNCKNSN